MKIKIVPMSAGIAYYCNSATKHFITFILTEIWCCQQPSFLALNCLIINKERGLGYCWYWHCYQYQHFVFSVLVTGDFPSTSNLLIVFKKRVLLKIRFPKPANILLIYEYDLWLLTKLIYDYFSPQLSWLGTAVLVRTYPFRTTANADYFLRFRQHSVSEP